jgi:hypothetical protein
MLNKYPLKTYQYSCSRLGATTPVYTYLAYYSEALPDYPHDAEIPFAATSYRMSCPNAIKCGVLPNKLDGIPEAWHLCPALRTLKDTQALPEQSPDDANPSYRAKPLDVELSTSVS